MTKFMSHIFRIEKYFVFKRDFALLENQLVTEIPDDVSIVEVNPQNIEDVREFSDESVLQEFRKFYANGCHGVYAYLDGVVIGNLWMEFNDTQADRLSQGVTLLLRGEGYWWYGNVDERYRGKRIYLGLRNKICEKAKSLGFTMISEHILQDNETALRSNRRYGGIISETPAMALKSRFRLIVIYKSDDRWFVRLRLLWFKRGIVMAWSKPYKFGLLLAKL